MSLKNKLVQEKNRLESEIRRIEDGVEDWVKLCEDTFRFATYAKVWFEEGNYEKKTDILRSMGQTIKLNDRKLTIELEKSFLTLPKGLENELLQKARCEPDIYCNPKQKHPQYEDVFGL